MTTASRIKNNTQSSDQSLGIDLLLIVLLAATVFLTNLGGARLWDIDEPRNAGCALEMMQRGDWVTPIFNDELRGQKPVLLYWLMMSAYQVFGVNEFAARFWSAILGIGTVVCTYLMGRQLFGRSAGLWSAIVLSTTMMFSVASRAATPDAPLIFFSTLSITLYVLLTFQPVESKTIAATGIQLRYANRWFPQSGKTLPIYVAMAFGVLAKGPIAAVLPCCIIGLFLMICDASKDINHNALAKTSKLAFLIRVLDPRRFLGTLWKMQPWWLLFTVSLIAAPWFIWAGIRTDGDFLRWFFFKEHLGRATVALENHSGGPWFYPLAILVGFFPWSVLTVPIAIGVWREFHLDGKQDQASGRSYRIGLTLALVWLTLQVLVFSLVRTKLPSYVTPCYPAIALIAGVMVSKLGKGQLFCHPIWIRGGIVTLFLVGVALWIGLPLVSRSLDLSGGWIGTFGLVPILASIIAFGITFGGEFRRLPKVLAVGSWAFVFLFFALGTQAIDQNRETENLWSAVFQRGPQCRLASYRYLESSWVYYAKQPIWELSPQAVDLKLENSDRVDVSENKYTLMNYRNANDGANADNEANGNPTSDWDPLYRDHPWQEKPRPQPSEFARAYPDAMILVSSEHLSELLAALPKDFREINRCRKFLKKGDLVLVGRVAKP